MGKIHLNSREFQIQSTINPSNLSTENTLNSWKYTKYVYEKYCKVQNTFLILSLLRNSCGFKNNIFIIYD